MEDIRVDGGVVASTMISGAVAFLAWIIKVAARQALDGLKKSIDNHAHAIDTLAGEVKEMRVEVSEVKHRLTIVETRQEH
jgi:uncharacterized protein YoxC